MMLQVELSQLTERLGLPLAIAGLGAHLLYWSQGERSNKEIRIWLYSHFTFNIVLFGSLLTFTTLSRSSSFAAVFSLNVCFYTPLFSSLLIYRAFFHRLGRFPGPFILRLSKLAAAYANIEKNQDYARIWALHKEYGDIVRVGPQELSVLDVDAVGLLYGPSSRCTRSPWYDRMKKTTDYEKQEFAVFHMRDSVAHANRRKAVWDKAFNIKALKDYEPLVLGKTDQFIAALNSRTGKSLSGPDTMQLLAYDIMGVIGWGESFHNIENWKLNPKLEFVKVLTAPQQILAQAPWLMNLLVNLPGSDGPICPYGTWIKDKVHAKLQQQTMTVDAISKIVHSKEELSRQILYDEGELMVIAGGDTVATTTASILFHLARNPKLQEKLQSELDSVPRLSDADKQAYYRSIASLPYLNACINEALRIQPPVQGGIPRLTPAEGLRLTNGIFIPGNTIISVPVLPLQRDPRYYVRPEEYIPERWTDEAPEMTLNKAAFFPFAGGAYMCVGKGLAYTEMRTIIAKIFARYNVRLADGEDGRKFLEETKDCHVAHLGDFQVVFTERGH